MSDQGTAPGYKVRLHPDVFVALAAIAWADGTLDPEEADAIVRAAVDAGLSLQEIAQIEAATVAKVDLERTLDRSTMTKEDRLFVYAVACWIARLDGKVTLEESDALAALGEKLSIPDRVRARAEALASEVAQLPDGDRPLRYDLGRLRALIGDKLVGGRTSGPPGKA
jgi:uncharacterized membrane protein YebE (DUF533 family)